MEAIGELLWQLVKLPLILIGAVLKGVLVGVIAVVTFGLIVP